MDISNEHLYNSFICLMKRSNFSTILFKKKQQQKTANHISMLIFKHKIKHARILFVLSIFHRIRCVSIYCREKKSGKTNFTKNYKLKMPKFFLKLFVGTPINPCHVTYKSRVSNRKIKNDCHLSKNIT